MKRPKLRKASKRVSCAKRFKIQRKVREHNRKLRKEAKKKGISRKPKKDVGVPNSAPFKEEVLREAEQRKQELEALKEQNRIIKQQERAAKRKKEKEAGGAEAEPTTKEAKKVEKAKIVKAKEKSSKTFRCCELNKVIEASDVIVEVLDARDPLGCRCPQLEETVLKHEGKKKLMFILNEIDLVPKENLEKWLKYLEAECPAFVFKASTQLQDRTVQQKKQRVSNAVLDNSRAASCFGRDSLLQTLCDLANKTDDESMLKIGVVGFPNVGKSSIINSLKGIRACSVGVQRGLTRYMQEVHISKRVKMIDGPGIVAAPCNPGDVMTLRSLQVEEKEESPLEAVRTLLKQCNQQHIMLQYNVPDYRNSLEFLTTFAKKRGFLQKGGVPDTELAATTFLNNWTGAKLSYHSRVPERQGLPSFLSDAKVTDLQSGLDMDKVRKGNEDVIKGVRFPNLASSISFNSKGFTAGVLDVSELPKETTSTTTTDVKVMDMTANTEEPEFGNPVSTMVTQICQLTQKIKDKSAKTVKFIPINTDLTSVQQNNNDDAYDFNTDFV
ncbi:guanine nucleotide-binding protein-like 3 [Myxocyprinus asiaticus]|uniref:guanine nucleotide-binding protein-like 3 n=1 Tax=Myxocyprinus asiaticus TaxID=70543 RepID=UPI0022212ECB|nr:guanine nucleotide-binding protein-like 3 [Myxocyprinus asiaticus]